MLQALIAFLYILSGSYILDGDITQNVDNGALYTDGGVHISELLVDREGLIGTWYLVAPNGTSQPLFEVIDNNGTLEYIMYNSNQEKIQAETITIEIAYGMTFKGYDENQNHIMNVVFINQAQQLNYWNVFISVLGNPMQVTLTKDAPHDGRNTLT